MDRSARRTQRAAPVSLDKAPSEQAVRVLAVDGDREGARLLGQLQIRVGAVLRVQRAAPLGGPLLVECGGSTVIISRRLARRVQVEVLA